MGAVFRWVKYIYEWCKNFAQVQGGGSGVGEIDALAGIGNGVNYFVDGFSGDDDNDGKSWAKAVKTIQKAIDLSDATIDWVDPLAVPKHYNTIWVRPGVYAENLTPPLFCHIVGLGIHGTDTQVEIHPTTGSCFAGIMRGTHLANLWMEGSDAAAPIMNLTVANMSIIEHCKFLPTIAGVTGIESHNSGWLTIRHCDFETGVAFQLAYGIHCPEGYFNNARVHDNVIFAGVGILFAAACNPGLAVIKDNFIEATIIGIDDNSNVSYLINNWIHAPNAIDHGNAATRCIANHVINGVAGAVEAAGTD